MTIVSGFLQEVSRSTLCQTRWKIEKLSRVLRPSYHLKSIYVLRQTRAILMGMQHLYDRRELAWAATPAALGTSSLLVRYP